MTNLYETMFLLDNREVKKGFEQARERVTALLTKHGAVPRVVRKWDERKLAYEIGRQKRGTYMLAYADAEPGAISKIERDAQLTEFVLRILVLRADSVPEKAMQEPFDQAIAPQVEELPVAPVEPVEAEIPIDLEGAAAGGRGSKEGGR